MFASLVIERDLLEWPEMPAALASWLQDAGVFAGLALLLWGIAAVGQPPPPSQRRKGWSFSAVLILLTATLAAVCYFLFVVLLLMQGTIEGPRPKTLGPVPAVVPRVFTPGQKLFLSLGGGCALLAVSVLVARDLVQRIRWRRIWAIALLSLKEAWRKGVVWICLAIPLIYLYSDWYLSYKAEDQLRQRVQVVYFALTILLFVTALLLGSFSIPNDVKSQTIHTVTTKPVERYEIYLGRFLGYALLLLGELVVLTVLSLFYVVRGITPEAAAESYRARVPLIGDELAFYKGSQRMEKGESVGREWDYRSYISGSAPRHYAVWYFNALPGSFHNRETPIPIEFTFDIFRTTKESLQTEGKGVACKFTFAPGHLTTLDVEKKYEDMQEERNAKHKKVKEDAEELKKDKSKAQRDAIDEKTKRTLQDFDDVLLEKYGLYVVRDWDVVDYHTQSLEAPAALFKKLLADAPTAPTARDGSAAPVLQILINIEPRSRNQHLGVAKFDLYILEAERPFWLNFIKGALVLWLAACLVLGLSISMSTYLSGVITFLATTFLCAFGLFRDYIHKLAMGMIEGGGALESMHRLVTRQGVTTKLQDDSPAISFLLGIDEVNRWWLRLVLNVIPDVTRFDLTKFVANGFDISWTGVLLTDQILPLLAYVLPWAILAYYLMRSREIANPM
jgi:hypothetical protein